MLYAQQMREVELGFGIFAIAFGAAAVICTYLWFVYRASMKRRQLEFEADYLHQTSQDHEVSATSHLEIFNKLANKAADALSPTELAASVGVFEGASREVAHVSIIIDQPLTGTDLDNLRNRISRVYHSALEVRDVSIQEREGGLVISATFFSKTRNY